MKDDTRWKLIAGMALVTLSLALYTTHYLLFHDLHHIMVFGLHELAFIPIEVLVVTLIIDQMLESREKKQRMEKLNMVIGTFFSTTGTPLLSLLSRADPCIDTLRPSLVVRDNWTDKEFSTLKSTVGHYSCGVKEENVDLEALRAFLLSNEEFMMRLVENPMIFEHESFTDLILAISHLTEELKARGSLAPLPTGGHHPPRGRLQAGLLPACPRVGAVHGVPPGPLPVPVQPCHAEEPVRHLRIGGHREKCLNRHPLSPRDSPAFVDGYPTPFFSPANST